MVALVISAVGQVAVVLALSLVIFGLIRIFNKSPNSIASFSAFIGTKVSGFRVNREFFIFLTGFVVLSSFGQILAFRYIPEFVMNESSPFYRLQRGLGFFTILSGFIYCYIQAALSEEILFRGLIAKRLIYSFGFQVGNIIQALLFWLIHFVFVGLMTKSWASWLQLMTFFSVFMLAWIGCYYNEQKANGSILPSWAFHGSGNFATFVTLAILLR